MTPAKTPVIEFPAQNLTRPMPCAKCGRELQVSQRVLLAFCKTCSAGMGVKR